MKTIMINLPRSWEELTEKQLYYVYNLITDNLSLPQIQTLCFLRWGSLRVEARAENTYLLRRGKEFFSVSADLIADAIHALDWIGETSKTPVRISNIGRCKALDASFFGVEFEKFIYCDNLYQGYLASQNHALLEQMATILYGNVKPNKTEKISIFYWWSSLKKMFSISFPNFFQPAIGTDTNTNENLHQSLTEAMNAQIRALTRGDISKEKEILSMDTWRALTELDAQAKENAEINAKYGKS